MIITWVVIVTGLTGAPPYTFHPYPSAPDCHRRMVHINRTYPAVRARCVPYQDARQLGFGVDNKRGPSGDPGGPEVQGYTIDVR